MNYENLLLREHSGTVGEMSRMLLTTWERDQTTASGATGDRMAGWGRTRGRVS